jgi:hypothetical protein
VANSPCPLWVKSGRDALKFLKGGKVTPARLLFWASESLYDRLT